MPNPIEALLHTACAHAENGKFDTAASCLRAFDLPLLEQTVNNLLEIQDKAAAA